MAKTFNLILKFSFHAKLVDIDLVEYFEELSDEFLLANVLVFAITISRSRTAVVNVVRSRSVTELLVLVFGGNAGLAQAAGEKLREGELFVLPHDLVAF